MFSKEIHDIVQNVENNGGLVSYRAEEDGTKTPYELNCSYIDALTHPKEDQTLRVKRMLVTQATILAMPGVPGIYFHSLVGSQNYKDGVKHSGINRTINREKYNIDWLEKELSKQGSLPKTIFDTFKRMISIRINEEAFNPFGEFKFLNIDERIFAIEQYDIKKTTRILALHNYSNEKVNIILPKNIQLPLCDILSSSFCDNSTQKNTDNINLEPYQVMWLKGKI